MQKLNCHFDKCRRLIFLISLDIMDIQALVNIVKQPALTHTSGIHLENTLKKEVFVSSNRC